MNEKLKIGVGIIIFWVVISGIFGLVQGKGFLEPSFDYIDQLGNALSGLIKIVIFGLIIWFIATLFIKK